MHLQIPTDNEECLLLALNCFKAAKGLYEKTAPNSDATKNLMGRMGNALNTTGSLYIHKATAIVKAGGSEADVISLAGNAATMLEEGASCFEQIGNLPNYILLTMNRAMCHRLIAESIKQHSSDHECSDTQQRELEQYRLAIGLYELASKSIENGLAKRPEIPEMRALYKTNLLNLTGLLMVTAERMNRTIPSVMVEVISFSDETNECLSRCKELCEKERANYYFNEAELRALNIREAQACFEMAAYHTRGMLAPE